VAPDQRGKSLLIASTGETFQQFLVGDVSQGRSVRQLVQLP
jgi:hypothetical protein